LERITKRAEADKATRFNNLFSALTYELLYEAYCWNWQSKREPVWQPKREFWQSKKAPVGTAGC
jgi:hypothetical protein